jgi:hypothetical protein
MKLKSLSRIIITMALVLVMSTAFVSAAAPNGAATTAGTPTTGISDSAESELAFAGNVTEVTVYGYSTTQSWQGFFGNVSGTIELADSNNKTMYNWTLASPSGEIFASVNGSGIAWGNIQCFNFTASGDGGDESGNGGTTNLNGTNLSVLESRYGLGSDDVDGVNETFSLQIGGNGHDAFYVAGNEFSDSECVHTKVYADAGVENNQFEEALLYESSSDAIIFASLLEQDADGFDDAAHDFEMLVLENGHNGNTATTSYYFYVELE